jgi:hypothetical protein
LYDRENPRKSSGQERDIVDDHDGGIDTRRLRFLGKETQGGGSPTLFDTDETMYGKEVYVLQGWKITDPAVLAELGVPGHEAVIAVPKKLMMHLPEDDTYGVD